METQLNQEQVAGLKRLVANPEWKTCLGLWQKQMALKEMVKSRHLRAFDKDSAVASQHYIDGIVEMIKLVEKHARPGTQPEEQPYS